MSKYDVVKRVKRLINRDCALTVRETKLAKASAIYHDNFDKLKFRCRQLDAELHAIHSRKQQRQRGNENMAALICELEARMQAATENVRQLQDQAKQCLIQEAEERHEVLKEMNRFRSLKVSTNTYINMRALPECLQGVLLLEEEHRSQWRPFYIANPWRCTPEELRERIWQNIPNAATYSEAWQNQVFSSLFSALQKD